MVTVLKRQPNYMLHNLSCPVILKIHTFEELASTMDVSHNKQTVNPTTSLEYKLNLENEVFSLLQRSI